MDKTTLVARTQVDVNALLAKVWDALVTPEHIKQYMFGTEAVSDWKEGSKIVWKGEWQGKKYEDKGQILKIQPNKTLQYSHFSPLAGQLDVPENYHTVTVELIDKGDGSTRVVLMQDNNASVDDQRHSEENWGMMLDGLKKFVESQQ